MNTQINLEKLTTSVIGKEEKILGITCCQGVALLIITDKNLYARSWAGEIIDDLFPGKGALRLSDIDSIEFLPSGFLTPPAIHINYRLFNGGLFSKTIYFYGKLAKPLQWLNRKPLNTKSALKPQQVVELLYSLINKQSKIPSPQYIKVN